MACNRSHDEPRPDDGTLALTGTVQVTGSTPFYQVTIETDSAAYRIHGELRDELERLQGARVSVTGGARDDGVAVTEYRLLEIGGFTPVVGILGSADERVFVRQQNGDSVVVAGAPDDLLAQLGAKVWVVLDESGRVRGYGVIREPR